MIPPSGTHTDPNRAMVLACAAQVMNSAVLGERKNMNLPGVVVDLPTITAKDEDDLVNFGLPQNIDMVAASFVRKASDIHAIRKVATPHPLS
jgi:pyruvate kinase